VSFAAITLCVASQRVFIIVNVHFVIDTVRELFDTPSYPIGFIVLLQIKANITDADQLLKTFTTQMRMILCVQPENILLVSR
jgi:hypothetical protein